MQNDERFTSPKALRPFGVAGALMASLSLGACAGGAGLPSLGGFSTASASNTQATPPAMGANDLQKATAYWGTRYAKEPTSLETAMSYAKNLKALGQKSKALAVLQQASVFHGADKKLAGEYGRLALELGQVQVASRVLAAADDPADPDWRVISARGAALAKQADYVNAIPLFEKALTLSENHPSVLNNLALAHAMKGEPNKAEMLLRQASEAGRADKRVRQNLALVLGLQGKYEEATEIAARDVPMPEAVQRVASIRQMVQLNPVSSTPSPQAIARAWAQNTTTLKPTDTTAAISGAAGARARQAMAAR